MRYCLQTDLKILTPSIKEQIYQALADKENLLRLTSEYNESITSEKNFTYFKFAKSQEEIELYTHYRSKISSYFDKLKLMEMRVYQLQSNLETEIFERLPSSIRNMPRPPYVRLQTIDNGDYLFPHTDTDRTTLLIVPVSNHKETTHWWKMTTPHDIAIKTLPDMDLIERVASARPSEGESWLYNTKEIHSVEREAGHQQDQRITINIGWSMITMDDVIPLVQAA